MNPTVEDEVTTLAYLGWVLQNAGFETKLIVPGEKTDQAYEQLWVHYGSDAKGRDLVVQLLFMEEMVQGYQQESAQSVNSSYGQHLQFLMTLPVTDLSERLADLDQLLATLNRLSPLGLFGYHPQEGVFYRHTQVINRKEPDPRLIAEIIESVGFVVERFLPAFDSLLAGEALPRILASLQTKGN